MNQNRRKKVLMYYSFGDKIGGPLTYINTIINSNLKEKYDFCTCFQNKAPGGMDKELLREMVKKIKSERPDIVHVHGLQSEGFYGVLASRLAGCKNIVTTVHGFAFDSTILSSKKKFVYKYFVEPFTIKFSKKIYCVCEFAAKRKIIVKNAKKRNVGVIYNTTSQLHPTLSRKVVRREYGIKDSDFVFIISARVCKEKGFEIIENSIKHLNKSGINNFKLIVLGDGDYLPQFCENLRNELELNQVLIMGHTTNVADFLNAADAFIFPSFHENLPISILEAGYFGLPVIASNVGGIPEMISNSRNGYLVNGFNPVDYAEKMKLLIRNPRILKSMSNNIKTDFEAKFSLDTMCKKISEVYEQLLT